MQLLNEKERRVLGALNKLGEVPVSAIADETLINRTALYHTIEGLIKKGLINRIHKEKIAYFRSIALSEYEEWARRQIKSVESETENLRNWLSTQKSDHPTLYSDIRYFEGVEGVKNLYADSWRDNEEKIIYAITDYEKAYETLGDFFRREYFPARVSHGVRVKSLLPQSASGKRDTGTAKDLLRDMRFINLFKDLGIEINIYGHKISLVAFDRKKPLGIIMKNEIMASAFRKIFEYLWKTAK